MKIAVSETLYFHDRIQVAKRQPNKGGWFANVRSGDDYTRDLDAWGKRELVRDRERDHYAEVIELYDGTKIESTARLTDHHDCRP